MEAEKFIVEVYRRKDLVDPRFSDPIEPDLFLNNKFVSTAIKQYQKVLPEDKEARILDLGCEMGTFLSACIHLGYKNLYGADFRANYKLQKVCKQFPQIKSVYDIESTIGDLLEKNDEKFDFIHLSHVIEHIPKYSLFYLVDSIYKSLNRNGIFFIRTPNMLGPTAMHDLYVTLGHEFGFTQDNLSSLLKISGFEMIQFYRFEEDPHTLKQKLGKWARQIFYLKEKIRYRLFQGIYPPQLFSELIVSGMRKDKPELFNPRFK
tara:strand:+ start:535 stop:1320 length:786 start_codon:yes stop_codon:yes gene_type:complete